MASSCRLLCRTGQNFINIIQPAKWSVQKIILPISISANNNCCRRNFHRPLVEAKYLGVWSGFFRQCSTQNNPKPPQEPEEKKPGLLQKLKVMYRDYWYVALPVHMATSAVWFGGFYYAVHSGVDVIAILQTLGVSEKLITPLKESSAGYFALAFALYKLATPLRYTVTIGTTTYAIKKLTGIGWIKPVPSRERIKEMIQERKDNLQDRFNESKQQFNESKEHYKTQMKEKRMSVMDEMRRYKTEMRNIKNKVKKM